MTKKPVGKRLPLSHRRPASVDSFWFGAAYYPEHWDADTRSGDPALMKAAGFNLVRMAEFAWCLMEPKEGAYDFSLFDETIKRLAAHGVSTMLCTPTAAPPRWLTLKHPEMLRVDGNGVTLRHGSRQHCCHSSPVFRNYSKKITTAMAEHFKGNPHVKGWQTDNELHCHFSECHCPNCQKAFREFLKRKYGGDVERLNCAWGTIFWGQTYGSFAEIETPVDFKPACQNPSQRLDYCRFLSAAVTAFQHDQTAILRAAQPQWFITHNGLMGHIDYRGEFTKDLDFLGYDVYPFFCQDHAHRPACHAFGLDSVRALSGNFMVPEHQSGAGGQPNFFHDAPEPGEIARMTYASIARGADSLIYFRWRTCRFGAEEYWTGIIDHDNIPRRRYDEVKTIGGQLARVGRTVLGTRVFVDCAIAGGDNDASEAHWIYPLGLPNQTQMAASVHKWLYLNGYAVGRVHPADDLSGLKLYVIPHWELFDPAWVPGLERFVKAGGTLIIGARTATRDLNNHVVSTPLPGCLADLAGVEVVEYGKRNTPEGRPLRLKLGKASVPADVWYEALKLRGAATSVATWEGRHLDDVPAISLRPLGKGRVVYVGAYFVDALCDVLLPWLVKKTNLEKLLPGAPKGVEVVLREDDGRKIWFCINQSDAPQRVKGAPAGRELLTDRPFKGGTLALQGKAVAIIANHS